MIEQNIEEVVLTKSAAQKSIEYFRRNLPEESLSYIFGTTIEKAKGQILFATDPLFPKDTDYESKSMTYCRASFGFMAREFPKLMKAGKSFVVSLHCHPINCLSHTDEQAHLEMMKAYPNILTGYYNDGKIEFFKYCNGFEKVKHRIVDLKLYDRQVRAFGSDAQFKLITSHVAVIGCGGASQLAYLLAEQGIGKLTLVDPDSWDKTSLNRVWIPRSHVGINKAESLARLVKRWRDVEVNAFPCAVEDLPNGALEDADVLAAMTDTFKSRKHVNRLAVRMKKPAVFGAVEIRVEENEIKEMVGQCVVYIPEKTPCYECNLQVDPKRAMKETVDRKIWRRFARKYGLPVDSAPVPSLANLNNIIVSLLSDETVKILTGYAEPVHYQYWDHLRRKLLVVEAEKDPQCPACGEVNQAAIEESDLISTEEALSKGAGD